VIELVCRRLGLAAPSWAPLADEPLLHPGRSARVTAERAAGDGRGGVALSGVVGELHPRVADDVDVRGARLIVAELDVAGLAGGQVADRRAAAPSRQPAAERDLAVVVQDTVPAAAIEAAIRSAAGEHLVGLRLFDIYRGAPLAADEKSVNWRLVFQAPDRTLTDAEVDGTVAAITTARGALGGRIRT
jgi:phenylalanyl-tRNA synthetase beta chain